MNKYLIALLASISMILPASVSANTSVSEGLPEKTEEITASQDELALIKDDSTLSPEEKLQREIAARKNIIEQALSLSLKEVDNLRVGLSNLQFLGAESREGELKAQFLAELDVYSKYFSDKAAALKNSADLNLEEVKAFAQEIISYRDTDYNSYLKKVVDFILLAYNADAIVTTEKRLQKISLDIKKLERLNLVKQGLFQENIDKVKTMTLEAKDMHSQAKLLILAAPAPVVTVTEPIIVEPLNDDTAAAPVESAPAPVTPAEANAPAETQEAPAATTDKPATNADAVVLEIVEVVKPTAGELITSSLNKIKSIYEVYIQISKDIRTAVGIQN